jgi:hypothetical protein
MRLLPHHGSTGACAGRHDETWLPAASFYHRWVEVLFLFLDGALWALGKPNWRVATDLVYGQVKKTVRRWRLVKVEHRMLWGDVEDLKGGLRKIGLSGRINTAFVERLNLTIRQGVCLLVRLTWGRGKYSPEINLHLQWWRGYYHFVRYHASLPVEFAQPIVRQGGKIPCRCRSRTPAMAAGLATRRWSVRELISIPVV